MKTIGLIGGMSWESTATYYRTLNELARQRQGGLHSAEILLWSFDFAEIEALQAAGDWHGATERMVGAAKRLERGGADCMLICTNTMHMMYDTVQASVSVPVLHIADAAAAAIKAAACRRPLLLATAYTMEQDFYTGRLSDKHGLDVMVPNAPDRADVHRIIYEELCQGEIKPASKVRYLEIADAAFARGADSVVFGCTEVGLLLAARDFTVPTFDTTLLHAAAATDYAMG